MGSDDQSSGSREYTSLLRREEALDAGPKSPDARVFPQASPEPFETPEAVPPPEQDFLLAPLDSGIPVSKAPPLTEPRTSARSKEAHVKLPPSTGGSNDGPSDTSTNGGEGAQKGNSDVAGTGGDTGGAGDGTTGGLYMPAPVYPSSARRRGIEGTVVVEVDVYPNGHCDEARVAHSSGHDVLDEAAVSAIRKWKYEARPGETPVLRRVRFVFKLQK